MLRSHLYEITRDIHICHLFGPVATCRCAVIHTILLVVPEKRSQALSSVQTRISQQRLLTLDRTFSGPPEILQNRRRLEQQARIVKVIRVLESQ